MTWHIIFFLKALRRLEEFRNNPHIKIPPKSPPTNFQNLGIFKNPIFIPKRIFLQLSAHRPSSQPTCSAHTAHPAFFLPHHADRAPPPPPLTLPRHGCRPLLLRRHGAPMVAPNNSPPLQSTVVTTPFTPSNGSQEGAHLPPLPAIPFPPSAPIKGESPIVLHRTSSRSRSLLPVPKQCPHRALPPLLLRHRHLVATLPPSPR
jgi:hypothetical protein